uniref:Uncharacterized protein n=1 Tax=viral metagenome TaxID=1070528 RepID=A0A2V0RJ93_9ZZZZ
MATGQQYSPVRKNYSSDPSRTPRVDQYCRLLIPIRSVSIYSLGSASSIKHMVAKANLCRLLTDEFRTDGERNDALELIDDCLESLVVKSIASLSESTNWSNVRKLNSLVTNGSPLQSIEKAAFRDVGFPTKVSMTKINDLLSDCCLPQQMIQAVQACGSVVEGPGGDGRDVAIIPLIHQLIDESLVNTVLKGQYAFRARNVNDRLASFRLDQRELQLKDLLVDKAGWQQLPVYAEEPNVLSFESVDANLSCSIAFCNDILDNSLCINPAHVRGKIQTFKGNTEFDTDVTNCYSEATYTSFEDVSDPNDIILLESFKPGEDEKGRKILSLTFETMTSEECSEKLHSDFEDDRTFVLFPGWISSSAHRGSRFYYVNTDPEKGTLPKDTIQGAATLTNDIHSRFRIGINYAPLPDRSGNYYSGSFYQGTYPTETVAAEMIDFLTFMYTPERLSGVSSTNESLNSMDFKSSRKKKNQKKQLGTVSEEDASFDGEIE